MAVWLRINRGFSPYPGAAIGLAGILWGALIPQ